MQWHPIAAVFPMLEGDALQELADDIAKNGLNNPILTFEGKVLDGRNREAACRIAQVEPEYKEFDGTHEEALAYSWSQNRFRRHLDSSRVAIAEARRLKLSADYAKTVTKMKTEASTRKSGKGTERAGIRSATKHTAARSVNNEPKQSAPTPSTSTPPTRSKPNVRISVTRY